MMKNVLNLRHFCIYFKNRPKSDLVSFRFVLYTLQWPKNNQCERRSFHLNSFCVLAGSVLFHTVTGRHLGTLTQDSYLILTENCLSSSATLRWNFERSLKKNKITANFWDEMNTFHVFNRWIWLPVAPANWHSFSMAF